MNHQQEHKSSEGQQTAASFADWLTASWAGQLTEAQKFMQQFFGTALPFMPPEVTVAGLDAFAPGAQAFVSASTFPSPLTLFAETDIEAMKALQWRYLEQQKLLWQSLLDRQNGKDNDFRIEAPSGDRRFAAPEWKSSPIYEYIAQSYLLNARALQDMAELLPNQDTKGKARMRFLTQQIVDALAPTNFAATNPEFVQRALDTQGESIHRGIQNLLGDLEKGRITMTDESQFEVGRNLATTAGSVIYENALMQLIQYAPLTDQVAKRPLLVVPPCINKYYIMDLQPESSLIRFLVAQGHTVFLISWKTPGSTEAHLRWDDYLENGPIQAISVVQKVTRQQQCNMLGFCIGGTLLASALAVLKARGSSPASSLTLLTTLLDFTDVGDIGLFIDETSLAAREASIGQGGLLQARELQSTFSALRPNDLIWNYVTNNYLKGDSPVAFDLLYWNSDSTNLPGPFACWYMRNLYLDNLLREAGKLSMCGTTIDLGKLDMPAYILATREDHIVPWHSAFASTHILGGTKHFVLGASGHIAGVINPASKNKRSYWTHDDVAVSATEWLNAATEHKGSWWSDWAKWLEEHTGGQKPAPKSAGGNGYRAIEPAPGRYVKERVV